MTNSHSQSYFSLLQVHDIDLMIKSPVPVPNRFTIIVKFDSFRKHDISNKLKIRKKPLFDVYRILFLFDYCRCEVWNKQLLGGLGYSKLLFWASNSLAKHVNNNVTSSSFFSQEAGDGSRLLKRRLICLLSQSFQRYHRSPKTGRYLTRGWTS